MGASSIVPKLRLLPLRLRLLPLRLEFRFRLLLLSSSPSSNVPSSRQMSCPSISRRSIDVISEILRFHAVTRIAASTAKIGAFAVSIRDVSS